MTDYEMIKAFIAEHEEDIDELIGDVPLLRWRLVQEFRINLPTAMRLVEQIRSEQA